jgi:predicted O-methyltransferase YrrM
VRRPRYDDIRTPNGKEAIVTGQTLPLDERLYAYVLDVSLRETPVLRRLREQTSKMPQSNLQIAPEQGQLMALLIRLIGAKRTIEIGVFTGYSSLVTAQALPEDGTLVACDVSEEWTRIARRYWDEAGVAGKIDLRLAPADRTLQTLVDEGHSGRFDFAFIDAEKTRYDTYYELCLQLLRRGGLVCFDNMLWDGTVADPNVHDDDTEALRSLNLKLRDDQRVDLSLVPIGDGLTLARKR